MNELEKLRADLVLAGWRIERNSLKNNLNLVDWYAWHPKRPCDWPNCQCNNKPPSQQRKRCCLSRRRKNER